MIHLLPSCWRPCMGLDIGCVYRVVNRGEEGVVMLVISRVYKALSLVIIIVGLIALVMQKNDVRSYSVSATIIIVDLVLLCIITLVGHVRQGGIRSILHLVRKIGRASCRERV